MISEKFVEDVDMCDCGCKDVVVEITSYIFAKREGIEVGRYIVISEEDGGEQDVKITCRNCEKVLDTDINSVIG